MRFRKTNALIGGGLIVGILLTLYLVLDTLNLPSINSNPSDSLYQKVELSSLELKLQSLETELEINQKTINKIKDTVSVLQKEQLVIKEESKAVAAKGKSPVNKTFASISRKDSAFAQNGASVCDIQMYDVYEKLPFDNPDGGVWKQGFDIKYEEDSFAKNKLKVIIMPHSHNDPGWLKTFEKYYVDQTKKILDLVVPNLSVDPRRKFIWAEISYFQRWWDDQNPNTRGEILKLLENGQLEIVTGGYVMNDEANTHYYAMLEQLIYGHEWCRINLGGYKPNNGWAIDPFGMTPTMAYMLKRMGFDSMLIQRTHYSVKKHLAKEKALEFRWRQHWDHEESTEILTHMMPFYSYDVPHTCGPDPKICCQFDFDRLPGMRATCPWKVPPKPITSSNIEERSLLLLDQYKKKAQLYKTNVVLVPLGDDFRYDKASEWDKQYENYQAIFDYVNSHPELNAELNFGTLADYFTAIRTESKAKAGSEESLFPSLNGDFFTYADRDDHYWSGYFTSRPFYKSMDRVLGGYLRAAEILYSLMWAEMEYVGADIQDLVVPLLSDIIYARKQYSLFQHHDGVTGTAKTHVMEDYGVRMHKSISKLQVVMAKTAHYLLTSAKAFYKLKADQTIFFEMSEEFNSNKALVSYKILNVESPDPSKVVLFNSHGRYRSEMVTIRVNNPNVKVYRIINIEGDDEEETLPCQLTPVFDDHGEISNNEYQLTFLAQVKAIGLQSYFVAEMRPEEGNNEDLDIAQVQIFNSVEHPYQVAPFGEVQVYESGDKFALQNGYVRGHFDANGFLQAITTLDDKTKTDCKLSFVRYETRKRGDKSGAYLFLPEGVAKTMAVEKPLVRIVEGKLLSYAEVFLPFVTHKIIFSSSPGPDGTGIIIQNNVDVRKLNNNEVAMRFDVAIDSEKEFFTDLNGFQMIKRKRLDKLPLQANYYPIASMTYIQDSTSRFTIAGRQPSGGSSLASGQLEVMLDRRLMQDDNRGLAQPVTDNLITPSTFMIVLERKIKSCKDENNEGSASYPSILGLSIRLNLLNPMYPLLFTGNAAQGNGLSKHYGPVEKDLACDIHLTNLRTMQASSFGVSASNNAALIVHRQGFNGCYKAVGHTCSTNNGKISIAEFLPELYGENVKQMTLSLMYEGIKMEKGFTVSIKPMEMYTFVLHR